MKRHERIQRYLDGEMGEEELKAFRSDLQRDPELIEELDLHRTVEEGIKSRDELKFRKKLEESYNSYRVRREAKTRKRSQRKIIIQIVSSAAAILALALYFTLDPGPVTPDNLFEDYYTVMDFDFSSRSASEENDEPNLVNGIRAYLEEDYQLSKIRLQEYVNSDSENTLTACFFLGLSELELGNYLEAESNFKRVINGEFSYYNEHSKWYLALTYLKTENIREAEKIFREFSLERSVYNSKSVSILKKMSKIK